MPFLRARAIIARTNKRAEWLAAQRVERKFRMVPASPSTNDLESEGITGDAILLSSTSSLPPSLRGKKRKEKKKKGKGEKKKRIRKHSLFIRGLKLGGDSARYFATTFKRSSPYYHRDGPRGRKRLRVSDIKRLMCNS